MYGSPTDSLLAYRSISPCHIEPFLVPQCPIQSVTQCLITADLNLSVVRKHTFFFLQGMATDPVQAETSNVLEAVPVRELVGHSNRITSGHYVTGIVELVYEISMYNKLSV